MRLRLVLAVSTLLLTPCLLSGQEAKPDSCQSVDLKTATKWVGAPTRTVNIRTGPGTDYPLHESGQLVPREEVHVLQECHGWLQIRVIPEHLIDAVIKRHGQTRAQEMLLFWVRKDLIQRRSTAGNFPSPGSQ
jgi:SH3-like domain-containing protein